MLDGSVSVNKEFGSIRIEDQLDYVIHGSKVIDLSKLDIEQLKKEIRLARYKAVEIDDLKAYIETALQQMLSRNCTRTNFAQRYRTIIDRYNAGGSENEDYYEQLLQLIEDLKAEEKRPEASELMVVDWYKDEQPLAKVKTAIEKSLDADLPVSYDKETFAVKIDLLLTHFIDMAVQGYGWIVA